MGGVGLGPRTYGHRRHHFHDARSVGCLCRTRKGLPLPARGYQRPLLGSTDICLAGAPVAPVLFCAHPQTNTAPTTNAIAITIHTPRDVAWEAVTVSR